MEGCAMGQILHGSATTTAAVRRAIQHSQESLRALARRYGINQKTVAKWKRRTSVADMPTGPKDARSTVLSIAEEAIVVALRKHTLLPLDVASLPATARHLAAAASRRRGFGQAQAQDLPDRLLSHRHRRSPHRAGQ